MLLKGLVTASVIAVTALAGAAPASALTTIHYGNLATGSFESYGEHFTVCDTYTDGYGARLDWYVVDGAHSGSVFDTNGNNSTCGHWDASITEGKTVMYRVCLTDNGATKSCTQYFDDHA